MANLWAMDIAEDKWPYRAHLIVKIEHGQFGEVRTAACGQTFTQGTHPRGWWSTEGSSLPLQEHAIHCGQD